MPSCRRTDVRRAADPWHPAVSAGGLVTELWRDRRGNVVKQRNPGAADDKMRYDGAGRPVKSFKTDSGGDTAWSSARDVSGDVVLEQTETAYDALGRRVVVSGGLGLDTFTFYSASWQELETRTPLSGRTEQFVWSPVYVDALVLRDVVIASEWGVTDERVYVQQDANYNVTSLTDAAGDVVERYVYDPYGERTVLDAAFAPRANNWSPFAFRHGHQGGRHDGGSGLVHFRHRDLSTGLGRWTRQDPAGPDGVCGRGELVHLSWRIAGQLRG